MSIQVHHGLRLVPIERKHPSRRPRAWRIPLRPAPKRIVARRKEKSP